MAANPPTSTADPAANPAAGMYYDPRWQWGQQYAIASTVPQPAQQQQQQQPQQQQYPAAYYPPPYNAYSAYTAYTAPALAAMEKQSSSSSKMQRPRKSSLAYPVYTPAQEPPSLDPAIANGSASKSLLSRRFGFGRRANTVPDAGKVVPFGGGANVTTGNAPPPQYQQGAYAQAQYGMPGAAPYMYWTPYGTAGYAAAAAADGSGTVATQPTHTGQASADPHGPVVPDFGSDPESPSNSPPTSRNLHQQYSNNRQGQHNNYEPKYDNGNRADEHEAEAAPKPSPARSIVPLLIVSAPSPPPETAELPPASIGSALGLATGNTPQQQPPSLTRNSPPSHDASTSTSGFSGQDPTSTKSIPGITYPRSPQPSVRRKIVPHGEATDDSAGPSSPAPLSRPMSPGPGGPKSPTSVPLPFSPPNSSSPPGSSGLTRKMSLQPSGGMGGKPPLRRPTSRSDFAAPQPGSEQPASPVSPKPKIEEIGIVPQNIGSASHGEMPSFADMMESIDGRPLQASSQARGRADGFGYGGGGAGGRGHDTEDEAPPRVVPIGMGADFDDASPPLSASSYAAAQYQGQQQKMRRAKTRSPEKDSRPPVSGGGAGRAMARPTTRRAYTLPYAPAPDAPGASKWTYEQRSAEVNAEPIPISGRQREHREPEHPQEQQPHEAPEVFAGSQQQQQQQAPSSWKDAFQNSFRGRRPLRSSRTRGNTLQHANDSQDEQGVPIVPVSASPEADTPLSPSSSATATPQAYAAVAQPARPLFGRLRRASTSQAPGGPFAAGAATVIPQPAPSSESTIPAPISHPNFLSRLRLRRKLPPVQPILTATSASNSHDSHGIVPSPTHYAPARPSERRPSVDSGAGPSYTPTRGTPTRATFNAPPSTGKPRRSSNASFMRPSVDVRRPPMEENIEDDRPPSLTPSDATVSTATIHTPTSARFPFNYASPPTSVGKKAGRAVMAENRNGGAQPSPTTSEFGHQQQQHVGSGHHHVHSGAFAEQPTRRSGSIPRTGKGKERDKSPTSGDPYYRTFGGTGRGGKNGHTMMMPPTITFTDDVADAFYGFSNRSPRSVYYRRKLYPTAEHLYQAMRFLPAPSAIRLVGTHASEREHIAEEIRQCPTVEEAQAMSRAYESYQRRDWNTNQLIKLEEILYLKFTQHDDLLTDLVGTHPAQLVWATTRDAFLGLGMNGRGRNELGQMLVRVRERLKEEGGL